MGITTSLFVCCLTCSSVAVKIAHHRSHPRIIQQEEERPLRRLEMRRYYFTSDLEKELRTTGSGRTVCPICCEEFGEDKTLDLAVLGCVHAYHFSCLESYAINRPNANDNLLLCPVCQRVAVSRESVPFILKARDSNVL